MEFKQPKEKVVYSGTDIEITMMDNYDKIPTYFVKTGHNHKEEAIVPVWAMRRLIYKVLDSLPEEM